MLGAELALRGHRVALIDRDQGQHLSRACGFYPPGICHGTAVNQVRQGVPLSEIQQQLGHARIDTTTICTKVAARERLAAHAGVEW
jgi:cellulose biosynthesis protein BcsQ